MAAWCHDHGVVLVADEIQSGFCRTGAWFASEHEGVVPDLITMAKGIAGGMPLATLTGRAEPMDAVYTPGGLGGTYGGNPVACAAALATIDVVETRDLAGTADRSRSSDDRPTGRVCRPSFRPIGEVRGRGAMQAIELVVPEPSSPIPDSAGRMAAACLRAGVIVLTCGTWGNVIRLLPPLVISDQLLDESLDVLSEAAATTLGWASAWPPRARRLFAPCHSLCWDSCRTHAGVLCPRLGPAGGSRAVRHRPGRRTGQAAHKEQWHIPENDKH